MVEMGSGLSLAVRLRASMSIAPHSERLVSPVSCLVVSPFLIDRHASNAPCWHANERDHAGFMVRTFPQAEPLSCPSGCSSGGMMKQSALVLAALILAMQGETRAQQFVS